MESTNKRIFYASCVALVVTAMTFAIRAGILNDLNTEFGLSDTQLGWVNSMAFLGFPLAMIVLGLSYNRVGPKWLMYIAFIFHLLGLLLTIFAGGFWGLIISTFAIGFANGSVEAACNPLIADMFPEKKTTMLNKFHVWFPGGIVIGALVAFILNKYDVSWQIQIATMIIPTIIYGIMIFGIKFPENRSLESNTVENLKGLINPLFIFIAICMTLTATTELGTTQWIEKILANNGAHPMLILAMVTGIMAVGRYFAGPIVKTLNPVGVLIMSSVISVIGLYLLSTLDGAMLYPAAMVFAVGVTYFWPTMIGFTGENLPKTGALGMSLVGGAGMFGVSLWNPVIGRWLDTEKASAIANGIATDAAELAAGKAVLDNMATFPAILVVLFTGLYFYMRSKKSK